MKRCLAYLLVGMLIFSLLPMHVLGAEEIIVSTNSPGYKEVQGEFKDSGLKAAAEQKGRFSSALPSEIRYTPEIPETGNYELYLYVVPNPNKPDARNVEECLVTVQTADGTLSGTYNFNQMSDWNYLGVFKFNKGTEGFVTNLYEKSSPLGNLRAGGIKLIKTDKAVTDALEGASTAAPSKPEQTIPTAGTETALDDPYFTDYGPLPDEKSFTEAPYIIAPSENEEVNSFPSFLWQEPTEAFEVLEKPVSYDVAIAKDQEFNQIIDEDVTALNRYVADFPLEPGQYYFRVRAKMDSGAAGAYSVVPFTVAGYDEIITVKPDNAGTDYSQIVDEAVAQAKQLSKQGKRVLINLEQGEYHFYKEGPIFNFANEGYANIDINCNDSTLYLHKLKTRVFVADYAKNMSLMNLTTEHVDEIPFIQSRVADVKPDTGEVGVKVEEGFPTYDGPLGKYFLASWGIILDPEENGKTKPETIGTYFFTGNYRKEGDIYYLELKSKAHTADFSVGDRFIHLCRDNSPTLTEFKFSEHITIYNFDSYVHGGLHNIANDCSQIVYLDFNAKIQDGYWFAGGGDGFHLRANKIGPWIENCSVNGIGDDAVALFTRPMTVMDQIDTKTILVAADTPAYFTLNPGDTFVLFEPSTGEIIQECTVATAVKAEPYYKVTVQEELPELTNLGDKILDSLQIWNRSMSSGDFVIRNNTFKNVRRYGNVSRSHRGVIENNTYEGVTSNEIKVLNETQYPNGLYSDQLIIQNNTFKKGAKRSDTLGVISFNIEKRAGGMALSVGTKNVLIRNNTFEDKQTVLIDLQGAENISFVDNYVLDEPLTALAQTNSNFLGVKNIRFLDENLKGISYSTKSAEEIEDEGTDPINGFSFRGAWAWSGSVKGPEEDGSNTMWISGQDDRAFVKYDMLLEASGDVQVYIYCPYWNVNQNESVVYEIVHNGKTDTFVVNQKDCTEGIWIDAGSYDFAATGDEYVKLILKDVPLQTITTRASTVKFVQGDQIQLVTPVEGGMSDGALRKEEIEIAQDVKVFTDLEGHWAKEDVTYMAQQGHVQGKDVGIFAPEDTITRAEFLTILNRILNIANQNEDVYGDVKPADWFYGYVAGGYKAGLLDSLPTESGFLPNQPITREEIALLLDNAIAYKQIDISAKVDETINPAAFSDYNDISDFAKSAMEKMVKMGMLKGKSDTTLAPKNTATRAEATVLLKRFLDL